jgi:hypothetical protein
MSMLRWAQQNRVEWHYIAPGKPARAGPASERQEIIAVFPFSNVGGRRGDSPALTRIPLALLQVAVVLGVTAANSVRISNTTTMCMRSPAYRELINGRSREDCA